MKPVRVILLVLGSILALVGLGVLAAGASLAWALGTQRDDAGFFHTSSERFHTDSYALTSDQIDLGHPGPDDWWADRHLATVRLRVDNAGSSPVFVGIGPEADVERYLAGVPHDDITRVDYAPFSADYRRENAGGTAVPAPPASQTFWVAQATGDATQALTWDLEAGRWSIVVMNADASPTVISDVELGGQIDYLVPLAIVLAAAGFVLLAGGTAMIVAGVAHPHARQAAAVAPGVGAVAPSTAASVAHPYPLQLAGHLDADLSRWRWLVKWFLAIPHFIVLVFLWIALCLLTVVAFFAILFTGRYPQRIFAFNVGVLRWSWRVGYYATSALGTDRYPPFTLHPVDYPATLDVAYPEHLSRGLVLVKSWLLAFPHLVIIGVLSSTWSIASRDDAPRAFGGGLLGVLVTVAGFALLFTGRYPTRLHELIVGINRWIYRVIAYVALMTDQYPPFQLDQGEDEPSTPPPPTPARPEAELAGRT